MKKRNSFAGRLIAITVIIITALFVYLFTLNEIKALKKEKDLLENKLSERVNKLEAKLVEVQKLSSEDRISHLAKTELGLVHSSKPFEKIYIDKNEVEQIKKIVNGKYE